MSRILIVDDEASICWAFREFLTDEGHDVDVASSAEEGLQYASRTQHDALLLDVRLPGMDGLTAMRQFQQTSAETPIIVMTAFGNLDTAVKAIEGGAFDYLTKPFDLDQAGAVIQRALAAKANPPAAINDTDATGETLVGASPAMQQLFKNIALAAQSDVPVLITGESGTGKELVARAIHRHSHRSNGPFLPICLAALSPGLVEGELFGHVRGSFTGAVQDRKGLLELAAGGTVLLDEIGDVPLPLQVKLLRTIEHREVTPVGDARPRTTNIRILAATNRPLQAMIAAGEFREDLFFRLSVFPIHVPPLRQRREDIPLLAEHFLRLAQVNGIERAELTPAALRELQRREWTGNVRELRNVIEHAAIVSRGHAIGPDHLLPPLEAQATSGSSAGHSPADLQDALAAWARTQALHVDDDTEIGTLYERYLELVEPPLLKMLLERTQGNRAAAAQFLGIHRATLRQKLKRYGIE